MKKIKRKKYSTGGDIAKGIGAGLYGVTEGFVDNITMGATDQLTDKGYEALSKLGKNSKNFQKTSNIIRSSGNIGGQVTGAILSGGATTTQAIKGGLKSGNNIVQNTNMNPKAKKWIDLGSKVAGVAAGFVGGDVTNSPEQIQGIMDLPKNMQFQLGGELAKYKTVILDGKEVKKWVKDNKLYDENPDVSRYHEFYGDDYTPEIDRVFKERPFFNKEYRAVVDDLSQNEKRDFVKEFPATEKSYVYKGIEYKKFDDGNYYWKSNKSGNWIKAKNFNDDFVTRNKLDEGGIKAIVKSKSYKAIKSDLEQSNTPVTEVNRENGIVTYSDGTIRRIKGVHGGDRFQNVDSATSTEMNQRYNKDFPDKKQEEITFTKGNIPATQLLGDMYNRSRNMDSRGNHSYDKLATAVFANYELSNLVSNYFKSREEEAFSNDDYKLNNNLQITNSSIPKDDRIMVKDTPNKSYNTILVSYYNTLHSLNKFEAIKKKRELTTEEQKVVASQLERAKLLDEQLLKYGKYDTRDYKPNKDFTDKYDFGGVMKGGATTKKHGGYLHLQQGGYMPRGLAPQNPNDIEDVTENTVEYNGNKHTNGGIPLEGGAELEKDETVIKQQAVGNKDPYAISPNLVLDRDTAKIVGLPSKYAGYRLSDISRMIEDIKPKGDKATAAINKKFALKKLMQANELLSYRHRKENGEPTETSDLRQEEMQNGGYIIDEPNVMDEVLQADDVTITAQRPQPIGDLTKFPKLDIINPIPKNIKLDLPVKELPKSRETFKFKMPNEGQIGMGLKTASLLGEAALIGRKPKTIPAQYNPYREEIKNAANRTIDIQPIINSINSQINTAIRGNNDRSFNVQRALNANTYATGLTKLQEALMQGQQINNQYKDEYAQILDNLGRQDVQARNTAEVINAQTQDNWKNRIGSVLQNVGNDYADMLIKKDVQEKFNQEHFQILKERGADYGINVNTTDDYMAILKGKNGDIIVGKLINGETPTPAEIAEAQESMKKFGKGSDYNSIYGVKPTEQGISTLQMNIGKPQGFHINTRKLNFK